MLSAVDKPKLYYKKAKLAKLKKAKMAAMKKTMLAETKKPMLANMKKPKFNPKLKAAAQAGKLDNNPKFKAAVMKAKMVKPKLVGPGLGQKKGKKKKKVLQAGFEPYVPKKK